ncbi:MAG: 3-hydroxyacyl-ACP dehydratase FabZ [Acidiferrobacterales bacterium]
MLNSHDIYKILELLPHRYPFLLIDRVLDYQIDDSLTALKNVTVNEPFFQGHFPERPIMPGVLILEAMAQASAVLFYESLGETRPEGNIIYLFVGVDKARFKRPVEPGDQLIISTKILRKMKNIWKFDCIAKVGDEVCCTCEVMCTYKEM